MKSTDNWPRDGLEILNPRNHPVSDEVRTNMAKLCDKMQAIQTASGLTLMVNRGYSTPAEQMKINPKASKSWHMLGAAADVSDVDGKLWAWLNERVLLEYGIGEQLPPPIKRRYDEFDIYLEDRNATPVWVHIQIYPPKSGKRIFKP